VALPKNKSRKIVVAGNEFRYTVSITSKDDGKYDFNIAIQSEEHNGCKLLLKGLVTRNFWLDFSDLVGEKGVDFSKYPTITPKHIEHFIKRAIENGWDYTKSGKNFTLDVTNEDLARRATGHHTAA